MKLLAICSNMLNEIDMLHGMNRDTIGDWYENMSKMADAGIIIVDGGSTDGTLEYFRKLGASFVLGEGVDRESVKDYFHIETNRLFGSNDKLIVVLDNIIQREGYGNARNHLRVVAQRFFPDACWMAYFDADERIKEEEMHILRHVKDSLIEDFDVVAFPRIDWLDDHETMAKDVNVYPDWQARMSRLRNGIKYIRKLHEQITGHKAVYTHIENPKINHFHRSATKEKRDHVGKVCAYLHERDTEHGKSYPEHKKEAMYRELIKTEGLNV